MDLEVIKQRAKAFDHLFDAVVVTDMNGIIIDWNRGSEALYGYNKEEAIGQPVSILHVPDDVDHITAEVIAAVAKDGCWTGEVRMMHKDGHIGWIESMCVPIFDDDNQMIGALGINRDITDRVKEQERLNHLAYHDHLTQLPNRYLLLERVEHLIRQSKRHQTQFSLLYIDLDDFKGINDSEGHAFGDVILQEMAARILDYIRESDTIARIGGDEFVLLLEDSYDEEDVLLFVKEFRAYMKQEYIINGKSYKVGCSIGIAHYPKDGKDIDSLLRKADKAMYQAKESR